ncbi:MAG: hypothetical protein MRERC_5c007 [Mycoplasmataceae bacterium RC_NB112A]|nr:MAG: hypothetical protein MRERC_5c007 [Mycoplasmataceae bacterium RC_NB112A]
MNFLKRKKEKFSSVNVSKFLEVDLWIPKYSYLLCIITLTVI